MNKNLNGGMKNWKNNGDSPKITNSLIFGDYKCFNSNFMPAGHQAKNGKEPNHGKVQIMHRHSSEEDFKKHYGATQIHSVESPVRVEQEYFPETVHAVASKPQKQIHSTEKNTKYYPKMYNKEKIAPEKYVAKSNILKETSSTQSAENLKINTKLFPFSIRSKALKASNPQEHRHYQPMNARTGMKRQNFKIILKLGQGKFGKVFMAKENATGFILAIKIVEKKKIIEEYLLEQFIRELKIQSFLNHPNIISLYGFFHDQTHFYELMELGCDGQLYSLIVNNRILSEETTSFVIKNLLEAVHYIHSNKVLHRDIKPENIVLIMGNVKICDFGWAVNKMHPQELRNTFCGTPLYLPPQILQGFHYNEKVDLWAIGILAYELMIGCSPFQIEDQLDLKKIITDLIKFPEDREVSEQFKNFIEAMLTKNPQERLTSKKLLDLQFITKYQEFETCQQLCK